MSAGNTSRVFELKSTSSDTIWDFNTLNASTIDLGIKLNPGQMDVSPM